MTPWCPYLGPRIWMLFQCGQDLLGHFMLFPMSLVEGSNHLVKEADVKLLVEIQQLIDRLLGQHLRCHGQAGYREQQAC